MAVFLALAADDRLRDGMSYVASDGAPYIRLASFTYDIHAPKHVQTFPIREEVAGLGVDFGVVVLRVKSNWGRDEFTCLYRFRVHGQRLVPVPEPWSPPAGDTISSSS